MQRNPNNLIREMTLSCSQGCPRRTLDPWAEGETHHYELMGGGPGLPYRLKGGLLLWGMGLRKECRGKASWMVQNLL